MSNDDGRFRVGLTRDLLTPDGKPSFGEGPLSILDQAEAIDWEYLPEPVRALDETHAARYDAIYVAGAAAPAALVSGSDVRLKLVARHGVGFDAVDVAAMTAKGVLVTNTPDAVRRPVAAAVMTVVLALAHRLMTKDRLTREWRWTERTAHMGLGLTTRTLGVVGAGSIGKETLKLARPFGLRLLAADPYADRASIAGLGATLVPLEQLLRESDFVCLTCALTPETRHLIDAAALAHMKPSAFLVNAARGPVVDEPALIAALREQRIAGAALDVFETEPVEPDNPLLAMSNVIVTPHALCWTDECFVAIAESGLGSIAAVANRRVPPHVVNQDVLSHQRIRSWLAA
jgi:phosphoglycerate dehydrogenase-like enzyme